MNRIALAFAAGVVVGAVAIGAVLMHSGRVGPLLRFDVRRTPDATAATLPAATTPSAPAPTQAVAPEALTTSAAAPRAAPAPPAVEPGAAAAAAQATALLLPVVGVEPAQLVDTFGDMRGEGTRSHEALDIMAPRGTQVVAAIDGPVAKLFTSKAGGLTVYQFDDAGRYAYYYAHLDSYAPGLREGQRLSRGAPVGRVGSTGNASADAPHLHFAIFRLGPEKHWWEGTAIDPYPLLKSGASPP